MLEEYELPATWAVVGHLFLDGCDGRHSSHPTPRGWFDRDPGGTELDHPAWFGRSLVESIIDTGVPHEIGSHTFSHVRFGASDVSAETAAAEAQRSVEAAEALGVELDSLCFPRNRVGHRDVLAEYGFTCYRGVSPSRWYDTAPARAPGKFLEYVYGAAGPPVVEPTVDEFGLVNIPASLHLFSFEGFARTLTEPVIGDPVLRQVRLGLEALEGTEGVLHLWLHPNDLVGERDLERARAVFETLAEGRSRGAFDVEVMGVIADRVRRTAPSEGHAGRAPDDRPAVSAVPAAIGGGRPPDWPAREGSGRSDP